MRVKGLSFNAALATDQREQVGGRVVIKVPLVPCKYVEKPREEGTCQVGCPGIP